MIDEKLIGMLRCPVEGGPLQLVGPEMIARINQDIEHGDVRDALGQRIELPIQGGLINESKRRLYPIRSGIPTLVADEAIMLRDSE